jgi:hypothetical protein
VSRLRFASSIVVAAALLSGGTARAQTPGDEAQVKAAFVYNFLKFVEWPAGATGSAIDTFVVVIVGGGTTAEATRRFLASKQVGDRPVQVRTAKWNESLAGAHAVLVTERDDRRVAHVLAEAAAAKVLSIGEGESFAGRGGVIALLIDNRKVRFDVDTGAANAAGLRISSKLLALTRVVHGPSAGVRE